MLLIKNEFIKLKRLKLVYTILIISFIPYIFNTIAMLLSTNMSVWNYYFYVYNQYATLFPALVIIFAGAFFNNEFQNKTTLSWLSSPQNNFSLILSKIVATMILVFSASILNHLTHMTTLLVLFKSEVVFSEILTMFTSLLLYSFIVTLTVPIAAFIMLLTKNFLSLVLLGVGSIFITTIILGAKVSLFFPYSFAWRFGMQLYEPSMGYNSLGLHFLGVSMLFLYILLALGGVYVYSRRLRMY